MLALSTILSGFQNLSSYVATERFNGTVKRFAGTPLPAGSYFIGKTGQTLYLIVAQTVLLLLAPTVLFDVPLPRDAGQWGQGLWPEVDGRPAGRRRRHRTDPRPVPDTKVLVLTTYDDDSDIMRAVESGAVGYLLKDSPGDRIIEAVRAAARGGSRSGSAGCGPADLPDAGSGTAPADGQGSGAPPLRCQD